MNKMQMAKGSVVVEATEEKVPTDAYFDFVECFGLAFLSMGTLPVERCGSPWDAPPTKSILPLRTAETGNLRLK